MFFFFFKVYLINEWNLALQNHEALASTLTLIIGWPTAWLRYQLPESAHREVEWLDGSTERALLRTFPNSPLPTPSLTNSKVSLDQTLGGKNVNDHSKVINGQTPPGAREMEQTNIAHRPKRLFIMPCNIGAANRPLCEQPCCSPPDPPLGCAKVRAHSRNKTSNQPTTVGYSNKTTTAAARQQCRANKEGVRKDSWRLAMH